MEEVYPGVNTVVLDEDAQGLEEPIIKPIRPKKFSSLLSEKGRSKSQTLSSQDLLCADLGVPFVLCV